MDRIRLTGYVRIYLRSLTPERELGRIAKTGTVLRRVRRLSPTCISALCTPGDAAKISGAGLPVRIAENVSAVGSSVWTSYYEYKYGEDGYGYYEYYGVKNFMIDSFSAVRDWARPH